MSKFAKFHLISSTQIIYTKINSKTTISKFAKFHLISSSIQIIYAFVFAMESAPFVSKKEKIKKTINICKAQHASDGHQQ